MQWAGMHRRSTVETTYNAASVIYDVLDPVCQRVYLLIHTVGFKCVSYEIIRIVNNMNFM